MASTTEESKVGKASAGIGDAASTVQEKAGELKEQGRGKLGRTLDQRTSEAGGQAREAALALRRTGEQMREQDASGNDQMAGMLEAAAARVERLGVYLERTSGDRMLRDVEDFARRRPWAVAGAGLLAGIAASRFLKASAERRYDAGTYGMARTPNGTASGQPATYGSPGGAYATSAQSGPVAGVT